MHISATIKAGKSKVFIALGFAERKKHHQKIKM